MSESFGYGQMDPNDSASSFNMTAFLVRQMIGRMSTMKLVQVQAIDDDKQTVDVLPLVNQIDGSGNSTPHGTVYGIPFFRIQGGGNAVKIDPKVGDIGYVVVSDRDISSVKKNKAQANPGSLRRFDLADGVYQGGLLNAAPTNTVEVTDDGINLNSPLATANSPLHATGDLTSDANISTATGNISAPGGQISAASAAISGSKIANSSNPMLTGAGGVALVGGFTETPFVIPPPANGGTITPNPSDNQVQLLTNNVAGFTIAATAQVGSIQVIVTNGSTPGTISFSGFSKQWAGDVLDTVPSHEFIIFIYGYGATAAYLIKAMQ